MMSKGKYSMQLIPHFLPHFHLPYLQFHAHSVLLKSKGKKLSIVVHLAFLLKSNFFLLNSFAHWVLLWVFVCLFLLWVVFTK